MSDRNLKILLAASLAANIFLVGGAGGALAVWTFRKAERPLPVAARVPPAGRQPLRFAADDLAPAQKQAFRQALRAAWRDAAPRMREARAQRQTLNRLLAEPTPDPAAVAAAMAGARQADVAVRARVETAVASFAAGLSPQERATFVAGLRRSGTLRATENPPPAR